MINAVSEGRRGKLYSGRSQDDRYGEGTLCRQRRHLSKPGQSSCLLSLVFASCLQFCSWSSSRAQSAEQTLSLISGPCYIQPPGNQTEPRPRLCFPWPPENVAGRPFVSVTANSTCNGETFCRVGPSGLHGCAHCGRLRSVGATRLVDGIQTSNNYWQSALLSSQAEPVSIDVTFSGAQLLVFDLSLVLSSSAFARPTLLRIETSSDGSAFRPRAYFAANCSKFVETFRGISCFPISSDTIQFVVSNAVDYLNAIGTPLARSDFLQNSLVSALRIVFLKLTLPTNVDDSTRQQPGFDERTFFFYSATELQIRATCYCNGHARLCSAATGDCECSHGTSGAQCDFCNITNATALPASLFAKATVCAAMTTEAPETENKTANSTASTTIIPELTSNQGPTPRTTPFHNGTNQTSQPSATIPAALPNGTNQTSQPSATTPTALPNGTNQTSQPSATTQTALPNGTNQTSLPSATTSTPTDSTSTGKVARKRPAPAAINTNDSSGLSQTHLLIIIASACAVLIIIGITVVLWRRTGRQPTSKHLADILVVDSRGARTILMKNEQVVDRDNERGNTPTVIANSSVRMSAANDLSLASMQTSSTADSDTLEQ